MTTQEKLELIAENQQRVYDAGYDVGQTEGVKSEYDRFWDAFQNNGGSADYYWAFSGDRFTDENYNPKYDIHITYAYGTAGQAIFYGADYITDTKVAIFAPDNNSTSLKNAFNGARGLKTIRRIDCHDGTGFVDAFKNCIALEDITFTGSIGKSVDFSYSPLTRASVENIIGILSTSVTDQTATFRKTAVEAVFTTEEWNALTATKPNWTFGLIDS